MKTLEKTYYKYISSSFGQEEIKRKRFYFGMRPIHSFQKIVFINAFVFLFLTHPIFSQTISYIIPDIGSAGQNTYVEIIGPYNQNANFGADGIYSNNAGDAVRLICASSSDTNKIKIGPVSVSWNGKMVSAQVFVMPGVSPNSADWQLLLPAYRIPLQVVLNSTSFSNADTFYIVQPQPAIITSGAVTLGGGGAGGIRSRRGAMIVSDLQFNSGANVTVSTSDCDPGTAGNQGFLPINVISRGRVFIDQGASVSLNAPGGQNTDGAPGGGGGGTESWVNCSSSGGTNRPGTGYTGGGAELLRGEQPGAGTGSTPPPCAMPGTGGISLNGVPGGEGLTICGADQGFGSGGTGHPFGSSGSVSGAGGYGGAGGGYGGGGFGSDGTTPGTSENGKSNGNDQMVPFSGGGGGSAGVVGSGASRGGGGGGGAAAFHAFLSSSIISPATISADGGVGINGCGGYRGGGGGSGGGIALSGKLNSLGTGTTEVLGGPGGVGGGGQGGSGGAGRVRIDGPFTTVPTINPAPGANSSTSYIGPSTDTTHYAARSFTLTGTGNGQAIRIYLKPISKPWQLLTTISSYGTAWTQSIVMPCPDTLFLLVAAQEVPSPSAAQYTAEPAWVFSQAAANIIIVKNALKAHAGPDVSVCPGFCTVIGAAPSVTGGVPPYTYLWAPAAGLSSAVSPNPTACPHINSIYALTVTDSSGCFHTDSIKINIYPKPAAKFGFKDVCLTRSVNFHDSSIVSSGSITGWSWNFGDGTPFSTIQSPGHIYSSPGTYVVTLIAASNNGCKDTIVKNIVVHPLPVVYFNTSDVCDQNIAHFNDQSSILPTDTIHTWHWNFGDATAPVITTNTTHLYALPGSYTVQLIDVSNFGCSDSITKTIIVHPNPVADFKNTSVCQGLATQFRDTSTTALGTITAWNWNYGDASPLGTIQNPSRLYASGGMYNVTLIVGNNFGCADTITKPIRVYYNPVADFSRVDVCLGDSLHFTNTSAVTLPDSLAAYLWVFGDNGPTGSTASPAHYYSLSGTYNATLLSRTTKGCSNAMTHAVKTYDAPQSAFSKNNICLFDSAVFSNTTIPPVMGSTASWTWNYGDNSGLNTTVWSPVHHYLLPGHYQVTLITRSSNLGCADTLKDSITVYPMPVAGYSFSNVCLNQPMIFNDSSRISSGSIAAHSWNFGDGTSPNGNPNPSHLYANPGTRPVTLIVTSAYGCKDTIVKNTVVHPLPHARIYALDVCNGTAVQFADSSYIAPSDTIHSWRWNYADNSAFSAAQNNSHLYGSAGVYPVQLFITSNFGCVDSVIRAVTVNPNPIVSFTRNDSIGCEPLCVTFQNTSTVNPGTNTVFVWNYGDQSSAGSGQSPFHCYHNDSVFAPNLLDVTLTVTSDSGCVSTKTKTHYITVYPMPIAGFTALPSSASIVNPVITITDKSIGANYWHWNFGDQDTTSIHNPNPHTYADTGTYLIRQIVSTQYNCVDTAYQTITIEPDFLFYIPNSFTPNDDGVNDTFNGKGIFIKEYEMMIFDRWGNLIFYSDDKNKGWDGRANHGADIAQRDVYIYSIKITDFNQRKHSYKGTVTLVR